MEVRAFELALALIALVVQGLVVAVSAYRTEGMAAQGTTVEHQEGQEPDGEALQTSHQ